MTTGYLKASQRELDPERTTEGNPSHLIGEHTDYTGGLVLPADRSLP